MKASILFFTTIIVLFTFLISCDEDAQPVNCTDVDLSAEVVYGGTGIDPSNNDFNGTAIITAKVTNVGSDDYDSDAGQQILELYEQNLGSSIIVTQATLPFEDLAVGSSLTVEFSREWSTTYEFPPEYTAKVIYDPDILVDGKTCNDDLNDTNDEDKKTGYELHDFFN